MKKGDTEQLYITDITAHGMGVGHSKDGAAVFFLCEDPVEDLLPETDVDQRHGGVKEEVETFENEVAF